MFTDFQLDDEAGDLCAREYELAAEARGCRFIPITLECEQGENMRRMTSDARYAAAEHGGKGLLTNVDLLLELRDSDEDAELYWWGSTEELVIDVAACTPAQVARAIARHILWIQAFHHDPLAFTLPKEPLPVLIWRMDEDDVMRVVG